MILVKYWQPLRLWIKCTIRSILEFRLALRRKRQEFFDCTPLINFKKLSESYQRIEGKVSIIPPAPPPTPPHTIPPPTFLTWAPLILISSQNWRNHYDSLDESEWMAYGDGSTDQLKLPSNRHQSIAKVMEFCHSIQERLLWGILNNYVVYYTIYKKKSCGTVISFLTGPSI